jgi:hypothetical protein
MGVGEMLAFGIDDLEVLLNHLEHALRDVTDAEADGDDALVSTQQEFSRSLVF